MICRSLSMICCSSLMAISSSDSLSFSHVPKRCGGCVTLLVFGSVHNLNYNFDTIQIIIPAEQGLNLLFICRLQSIKTNTSEQACEQLNGWIGGFETILKWMTQGNFNLFLHTMLFLHTVLALENQKARDDECT